MPPAAASVTVYAAPVAPSGKVGAVVSPSPAATDSVKSLDARFELASISWTVKAKEPDALGVPSIWPFEFKLKPAGKAPAVADQV